MGSWVVASVRHCLGWRVFFGAQQRLAGLVVIGLMWLAIVLFIANRSTQARGAAWLFVPYLLWVSYALSLNAGIVALNG